MCLVGNSSGLKSGRRFHPLPRSDIEALKVGGASVGEARGPRRRAAVKSPSATPPLSLRPHAPTRGAWGDCISSTWHFAFVLLLSKARHLARLRQQEHVGQTPSARGGVKSEAAGGGRARGLACARLDAEHVDGSADLSRLRHYMEVRDDKLYGLSARSAA